jgi:hypothetical protein
VILDVFPVALRKVAKRGGLAAEGDATCFFHEHRPAELACDGCGRYLCRLCDIPVGKEHLCPECLEKRNDSSPDRSLPNERIVWDRLAITLAVVPILFGPLSLITAPIVLFLCVRYWRAPGRLVGRAWPRFLVAGLFAVGEILFWGFLFLGVGSARGSL